MRPGPLALAALLALSALGPACLFAPKGRCDTIADCDAGERCDAGVCVATTTQIGGGSGGGVDPVSFTTVNWSRLDGRVGTTFRPDSVGADPTGNAVVVAGALEGAYAFGPTSVTTGAFVVKRAALGALGWARAFPTFSHGGFRTAVLPGGDVLFAGAAIDPTTVDTFSFTPPAAGALVLGRLGATGALVWAVAVADTHPTAPLLPAALSTHGADLLVAGTGSGDFGCGDTGSAAFAASLSAADGTCLWSRGLATRTVSDLEPRDTGEVAIAGLCTPSGASFDPGGGTSCTKGLFLAVLDANGQTVWARTTSGAGQITAARDLAVAPDGSATVIGDATGAVAFGGAAVAFGSVEGSFAATWSPAGAPRSVVRPIEAPYAADPDAALFSRGAYDRKGKLWIAGRYLGQPTLGGIRFSACRPPGCLSATFLAVVEGNGGVSSFLPIRAAADASGVAYADDLVLCATTGTVAHALRFSGTTTVGTTAWTGVAGDLGVLRLVP